MASDSEASCESDPNFAVICAFLEKFGGTCGLNNIDFLDLQVMLENTQEVSQELIKLHVKLLRKARKSVSSERWERAIIKLCHGFCSQDAWEIERFGYKKARISSKLRILKELLEMQFDFNSKFKNDINKMSAEELRTPPLGRDRMGHIYWFQTDESCQIRVYKEDPDEETWTLVAKDREGLIALISQLTSNDTVKVGTESVINEDSNSLVEKPIIDTGQNDSNSSTQQSKSSSEEITDAGGAILEPTNSTNSDEIDSESKSELQSVDELKSTSNESGQSEEKEAATAQKADIGSVDQNVPISESEACTLLTASQPIDSVLNLSNKPADTDKTLDLSINRNDCNSGIDLSINKMKFKPIAEARPEYVGVKDKYMRPELTDLNNRLSLNVPSFGNPVFPHRRAIHSAGFNTMDVHNSLKRPLEEEIEEPSDLKRTPQSRPSLLSNKRHKSYSDDEDDANQPVMMVKSDGQLETNESVVSEAIEEPLMYVYGQGSGRECETGNENKQTDNDEQGTSSEKSDILNSINSSDLNESHCKVVSASKYQYKLGTIIDIKTDKLSGNRSPVKKSRWDIGKPESNIKEEFNDLSFKIPNDVKQKGRVQSMVSKWEQISAKPESQESEYSRENEFNSRYSEKTDLNAPKKMTFFFGPSSRQFTPNTSTASPTFTMSFCHSKSVDMSEQESSDVVQDVSSEKSKLKEKFEFNCEIQAESTSSDTNIKLEISDKGNDNVVQTSSLNLNIEKSAQEGADENLVPIKNVKSESNLVKSSEVSKLLETVPAAVNLPVENSESDCDINKVASTSENQSELIKESHLSAQLTSACSVEVDSPDDTSSDEIIATSDKEEENTKLDDFQEIKKGMTSEIASQFQTDSEQSNEDDNSNSAAANITECSVQDNTFGNKEMVVTRSLVDSSMPHFEVDASSKNQLGTEKPLQTSVNKILINDKASNKTQTECYVGKETIEENCEKESIKMEVQNNSLEDKTVIEESELGIFLETAQIDKFKDLQSTQIKGNKNRDNKVEDVQGEDCSQSDKRAKMDVQNENFVSSQKTWPIVQYSDSESEEIDEPQNNYQQSKSENKTKTESIFKEVVTANQSDGDKSNDETVLQKNNESDKEIMDNKFDALEESLARLHGEDNFVQPEGNENFEESNETDREIEFCSVFGLNQQNVSDNLEFTNTAQNVSNESKQDLSKNDFVKRDDVNITPIKESKDEDYLIGFTGASTRKIENLNETICNIIGVPLDSLDVNRTAKTDEKIVIPSDNTHIVDIKHFVSSVDRVGFEVQTDEKKPISNEEIIKESDLSRSVISRSSEERSRVEYQNEKENATAVIDDNSVKLEDSKQEKSTESEDAKNEDTLLSENLRANNSEVDLLTGNIAISEVLTKGDIAKSEEAENENAVISVGLKTNNPEIEFLTNENDSKFEEAKNELCAQEAKNEDSVLSRDLKTKTVAISEVLSEKDFPMAKRPRNDNSKIVEDAKMLNYEISENLSPENFAIPEVSTKEYSAQVENENADISEDLRINLSETDPLTSKCAKNEISMQEETINRNVAILKDTKNEISAEEQKTKENFTEPENSRIEKYATSEADDSLKSEEAKKDMSMQAETKRNANSAVAIINDQIENEMVIMQDLQKNTDELEKSVEDSVILKESFQECASSLEPVPAAELTKSEANGTSGVHKSTETKKVEHLDSNEMVEIKKDMIPVESTSLTETVKIDGEKCEIESPRLSLMAEKGIDSAVEPLKVDEKSVESNERLELNDLKSSAERIGGNLFLAGETENFELAVTEPSKVVPEEPSLIFQTMKGALVSLEEESFKTDASSVIDNGSSSLSTVIAESFDKQTEICTETVGVKSEKASFTESKHVNDSPNRHSQAKAEQMVLESVHSDRGTTKKCDETLDLAVKIEGEKPPDFALTGDLETEEIQTKRNKVDRLPIQENQIEMHVLVSEKAVSPKENDMVIVESSCEKKQQNVSSANQEENNDVLPSSAINKIDDEMRDKKIKDSAEENEKINIEVSDLIDAACDKFPEREIQELETEESNQKEVSALKEDKNEQVGVLTSMTIINKMQEDKNYELDPSSLEEKSGSEEDKTKEIEAADAKFRKGEIEESTTEISNQHVSVLKEDKNEEIDVVTSMAIINKMQEVKNYEVDPSNLEKKSGSEEDKNKENEAADDKYREAEIEELATEISNQQDVSALKEDKNEEIDVLPSMTSINKIHEVKNYDVDSSSLEEKSGSEEDKNKENEATDDKFREAEIEELATEISNQQDVSALKEDKNEESYVLTSMTSINKIQEVKNYRVDSSSLEEKSGSEEDKNQENEAADDRCRKEEIEVLAMKISNQQEVSALKENTNEEIDVLTSITVINKIPEVKNCEVSTSSLEEKSGSKDKNKENQITSPKVVEVIIKPVTEAHAHKYSDETADANEINDEVSNRSAVQGNEIANNEDKNIIIVSEDCAYKQNISEIKKPEKPDGIEDKACGTLDEEANKDIAIIHESVNISIENKQTVENKEICEVVRNEDKTSEVKENETKMSCDEDIKENNEIQIINVTKRSETVEESVKKVGETEKHEKPIEVLNEETVAKINKDNPPVVDTATIELETNNIQGDDQRPEEAIKAIETVEEISVLDPLAIQTCEIFSATIKKIPELSPCQDKLTNEEELVVVEADNDVVDPLADVDKPPAPAVMPMGIKLVSLDKLTENKVKRREVVTSDSDDGHFDSSGLIESADLDEQPEMMLQIQDVRTITDDEAEFEPTTLKRTKKKFKPKEPLRRTTRLTRSCRQANVIEIDSDEDTSPKKVCKPTRGRPPNCRRIVIEKKPIKPTKPLDTRVLCKKAEERRVPPVLDKVIERQKTLDSLSKMKDITVHSIPKVNLTKLPPSITVTKRSLAPTVDVIEIESDDSSDSVIKVPNLLVPKKLGMEIRITRGGQNQPVVPKTIMLAKTPLPNRSSTSPRVIAKKGVEKDPLAVDNHVVLPKYLQGNRDVIIKKVGAVLPKKTELKERSPVNAMRNKMPMRRTTRNSKGSLESMPIEDDSTSPKTLKNLNVIDRNQILNRIPNTVKLQRDFVPNPKMSPELNRAKQDQVAEKPLIAEEVKVKRKRGRPRKSLVTENLEDSPVKSIIKSEEIYEQNVIIEDVKIEDSKTVAEPAKNVRSLRHKTIEIPVAVDKNKKSGESVLSPVKTKSKSKSDDVNKSVEPESVTSTIKTRRSRGKLDEESTIELDTIRRTRLSKNKTTINTDVTPDQTVVEDSSKKSKKSRKSVDSEPSSVTEEPPKNAQSLDSEVKPTEKSSFSPKHLRSRRSLDAPKTNEATKADKKSKIFTNKVEKEMQNDDVIEQNKKKRFSLKSDDALDKDAIAPDEEEMAPVMTNSEDVTCEPCDDTVKPVVAKGIPRRKKKKGRPRKCVTQVIAQKQTEEVKEDASAITQTDEMVDKVIEPFESIETSQEVKKGAEVVEEEKDKEITKGNESVETKRLTPEKDVSIPIASLADTLPIVEPLQLVANVSEENDSSSGDDIVAVPDTDPLACSEDEVDTILENQKEQPLTLATFKLDVSDSPPVIGVKRKRDRESVGNDDAEGTVEKRPKIRGKRSVDVNLRHSIEEQKMLEISSSDDDNGRDLTPPHLGSEEESVKKKGNTTSKHMPHLRKATDSPIPSSDVTSENSRTDTTDTPPVSQKSTTPRKKKKKTLLGLEVPSDYNESEFQQTSGVRQSRRIAQLKIKEDAERRKLEEIAMAEIRAEKVHKHKKDDDKDYKSEKRKRNKTTLNDEETGVEGEVEEKKKKKRKKKKHKDPRILFDESNPWRSSSGSSTSNEEDEEDEIVDYSDDESQLFKSDHEFSPESDLEDNAEVQPMKRARTARKESDVEEIDDCACQKCGKSDHPEWILLCDGCDNGWHCSCLRPALLVIPEGDWFCPPCQHNLLLQNLQNMLMVHSQRLIRRDLEERRKERLAYVGICLNNVLPPTTKEPGDHVKHVKHKSKHIADQEDESDDGDDEQGDEDDSDSDDSDSESETETSSGSESEPVYQLRERRQAHSYRFTDYDELINSAIQDEMEAIKGAGNQGRGKDISTIVNAEKEEEALRLKAEALAMQTPTPTPVATAELQQTETPPQMEESPQVDISTEQPPPVIPADTEARPLEKDEDSDDDDPIHQIRKKHLGRKKHKKLNSLDVSSGDDDTESDEDFKGSSTSNEEEDIDDEDLGSESSDDLDTGRRRYKDSGPIRRSTRARISRYDREFINDDSDDDGGPRRKKTRPLWDDEESESEESDRSWGRRSRRKAKQPRRKSTSSVTKKRKIKKKKNPEESDPEVFKHARKPKIKYGGLNDEDEEIGRRTRGKKINYLEALGSDSDDEVSKKPIPRPIQSEEEYVMNEDELENAKACDEIYPCIPPMLSDMNMQMQPRPPPPPPPYLLGQDYSIKHLETGPLSLISSQESTLLADFGTQDMEEEPNPIDVINKNLEEMNESEMEKMMEEEEYATKQLQLVALQIEKEKKRKEREAKKLEILAQHEQKSPKKRGRKPKDLLPGHQDIPSLIMASELHNNAELSEPPGVSLPLFGEMNPDIGLDDSPKKRRGRGKGKKTLAAEQAKQAAAAAAAEQAAAAAAAAACREKLLNSDPKLMCGLGSMDSGARSAGSNTASPAPDSPMHGGKLGIAAPPQPFSQSQPTPSVITRMLQSQPGHSNYPITGAKYFAGPQNSVGVDAVGTVHPSISSPAGIPVAANQFMTGTQRSQVSSPYRQTPPGVGHYPVLRGGPPPPHQMRSPGPQGIPQHVYQTHRVMDPSPTGGGQVAAGRNSPTVVPPAAGSPLNSKGEPTPPPPPYPRPQMVRFPPVSGTPPISLAQPQRHLSMIPPPHLQQPRPTNVSPYHHGLPPNYYGSYPPTPIGSGEEAMPPTVYQNSPYGEHFSSEGQANLTPSENSNSKSFDEETGGEFGGLVSYFSSQREDDLDT